MTEHSDVFTSFGAPSGLLSRALAELGLPARSRAGVIHLAEGVCAPEDADARAAAYLEALLGTSAGGENNDEAQSRAVAAAFELLCALVGGVAGDVTNSARYYDARSRSALKIFTRWARLPWRKVAALEALAGATIPETTPADAHVMVQTQSEGGDVRVRVAKVAAAASVGGALLAVTGGLAAPAIGAAVAAAAGSGVAGGLGVGTALGTVATGLSTSAGTAGVTSALGGWGASKMANKMMKRTAPVREFVLLALGPAAQPTEARDREVARAMMCRTSDGVRLCAPPQTLNSAGKNLAVLLCVSGWVGSRGDYVEPWQKALTAMENRAEDVDIAALVWEVRQDMKLQVLGKHFFHSQICQMLARSDFLSDPFIELWPNPRVEVEPSFPPKCLN